MGSHAGFDLLQGCYCLHQERDAEVGGGQGHGDGATAYSVSNQLPSGAHLSNLGMGDL
jgi:hypothetical protein